MYSFMKMPILAIFTYSVNVIPAIWLKNEDLVKRKVHLVKWRICSASPAGDVGFWDAAREFVARESEVAHQIQL
jgi:hypothetical protein